jgi:hypothetical protein
MKGFPAAARETLANAQLRRNLGKVTTTICEKRLRAVGEVPDWEALRDAGAAIKARALATLPEQLQRLEASVARAGGVVHWARDGKEANAIVAQVARAHGAREVVKVKSIATDEIGLNDALAKEGISAIKRDLAELILQLSHDRTSHILVPAIHRNRAEVRAVRAHDRLRAAVHGGERAHRGGAPAPAGEVPVGSGGGVGGELRRGRDQYGGGRRVRGKRAHVHHAAEGARDRDGDREGAARVARPRGVPAAAAALVHGRADEPGTRRCGPECATATARRSST